MYVCTCICLSVTPINFPPSLPLPPPPPSFPSQERQRALENMGISIQEAGIGVQSDKYYLVNLNADPSMNELLVCYLKVCVGVGVVCGCVGVWVGVCVVDFCTKW